MNVTPALITDLTAIETLKPVASPAKPSALATAMFNSIVQAEPDSSITTVSPSYQITTPDVTGPVNLGNKILDRLKQSSNDISRGWQEVSESLGSGKAAADIATLLHAQSQMLRASVYYEIIGKGVSKATQNIDSLVRIQ